MPATHEIKISVIVQNGRVEQIVSDYSFITADVIDLDCINAGYGSDIDFKVSGCTPEAYKKEMDQYKI